MKLLAAPFAGSVAGVLVRRLPRGRPVAWARSGCEACGRVLGPTELVPLLSFVALRGRCRGCRAPIPRFNPAIELASVAVAAWVVLVSATPWWDCALGWTLLALGWIDWEHQRLPDVLTLPLVALGLVAAWWTEPWRLLDCAIGAVVGYLAFTLLARAYRAWRGRDGLGGGDAKLLAAAGAWVGWDRLDHVVLLGALLTIGAAVARARTVGLPGGMAVPFGPGLAAGLMLVRLHG